MTAPAIRAGNVSGSPIRIRTLIEDEGIRVGSRRPAERELALQLGVSWPSLREALITLGIDGGVDARLHGLKLDLPGPQNMPDLRCVSLACDGKVVRRRRNAAKRVSPAVLSGITSKHP